MAVGDQRLIFGGRELDGSKTLEELNVHPKEVKTAHLPPPTQGGSCGLMEGVLGVAERGRTVRML